MANSRSVIVLGGGVGGLIAARVLRKRLRSSDRVVLIDRERQHLFQPSLLWLAVGQRTAENIQRPLDRVVDKGIEVVTGEVTELNPEAKRVRVNGADLVGDAMIISLGADLAPELVPGLSEAGHNIYTLEGASALCRALDEFSGGRVVVLTATPAYKCPAAPYETAMLVNDLLVRRGVRDVRVEIYAAEPGPMATAGPEVSAMVRGMVAAEGIAYHPQQQIERVDPDRRMLHFTTGSSTDYDLLIYVPPHRAPAVVRQAGLLADSGWIAVDAHTLQTRIPGVFAIGDVTSIPIPSGKALPKAGVFANREALVVAENLAAEWSGRATDHAFDGTGACFVETGNGRAGYGSGNFYASPMPEMHFHAPSRWWHWGKIAYEKYWFRKWF
jgi:sulfide:quinone oxidoreductase